MARIAGLTAVGNGVRFLEEGGRDALPDASDILLLPQSFAALPPRPIYGRAPDAKPMVQP
jgi:tRNA threonylcarbamoyladenosine biosynthesis protein TsaB